MSEYNAFSSQNTKTLTDLPGCPGQQAVIRALNGKRIRKASEAYQMDALAQVDAFGGASRLQELQGIGGEEGKKAALEAFEKAKHEAQSNPLAGLDRDEVIVQGVVSWSLKEDLTPENVADLNDPLADYFAREIMQHTRPALTEADEKKDSGPSTAD